ncbi:MAG: rod shape-determining protein MreC [Patescibacteria group bacterium]|jgi:rod shape-determining protein MreC|nr:rod shape-determining protein MreC [Patescibacteria group bacterium]
MPKSAINSKKTFIYLAVIGLLIFLHFTGISKPIEGLFARVMNPVSKVFYSGGSKIRNAYGDQVDKRDQNFVITELQQDNRKLLAENAKLKTIEEENEYLKNQIDFRKENDYKYLLAEIVSRNDLMNNSSEEKSIIIDKGARDGLREGFVLLDGEGVVIGKIIEARDSISRACLVVDKKCKFAAAVQNEDRTSGVVEGELGLTMKMDLIPQTEVLEKGNIIVSSGLENNIPRGLVIGRVSEVIKENNNLWQSAVIEPLVNFDDLVIVSIVISE